MIYGIGTDICQIPRIEAALARHGDRFAQKILGPQEMEKYLARKAKNPVRGIRFVATRFAANRRCLATYRQPLPTYPIDRRVHVPCQVVSLVPLH